jgi:hypothetical protein
MATQTAVVSKSATNAEALARARTGISLANYPTIYRGFTEKGVPECEIRPRENVFTYRAWRELGRQSVAANTASRSSRSSNARRKTKRLERSRKSIAVPGRRRCFTFHRQTRFRGCGVSTTSFAFPQCLAEKYRPTRIADFIGLEHPKKVLTAFCKRPASGAWLFAGPSGLGKSTMALAVAAELAAELHAIPSQKCNAQSIEDTVRHCWYAPMTPGGFHLVLADEADQMTNAAQLALLSKLDSTDPAPNTIWIFTANDTERLERRFLSRCKVLEFSSYSLAGRSPPTLIASGTPRAATATRQSWHV